MDEIQINPIKDALAKLAREDESLGASPVVEAALRTAFQRHRSRHTYQWAPLAAAAALVVGISGAYFWPAKSPAPVAQKATAPTEVGTDYFPLRAGPVLDAGEIGQVMRVPASPTLLARFGLARAGAPSNIFVNADVLVGMDGTARAVRFVR